MVHKWILLMENPKAISIFPFMRRKGEKRGEKGGRIYFLD
jgi:hypothetical protein